MSQDEIDATKAPLLDHLMELRTRLIRGLVALGVAFVACYFVAGDIFNLLVVPYERARGEGAVLELIYTAPHEFFFTQMKLALFGGFFLAFPIIAMELWKFVAPGLYRNERRAFLPFLVATPVLFLAGAAMVYFAIMPLALRFFLGFEQAGGPGEVAIHLLPKVSEYLNLVMTLVLAFGLCFQLPVLLTLLGRVGIVSSNMLKSGRKYALVGLAVVAALLTPPDIISQVSLLVPIAILYEVSIVLVRGIERRRQAGEAASESVAAPGE